MDPILMASLKIFRRSFIFLLLSSSILYTQSFMTTNNANDIFRKMCFFFEKVCKNDFTMRVLNEVSKSFQELYKIQTFSVIEIWPAYCPNLPKITI